MLIFEDLVAKEYATENQEVGLNLEQSKHVLEKLAIFHATSAVLLNQVNRFYFNNFFWCFSLYTLYLYRVQNTTGKAIKWLYAFRQCY